MINFSRQHVSEKTDNIFEGLLNILGTAGDILVIGYDYNDRTLCRVLQICRKKTWSLTKINIIWDVHLFGFLEKIIPRHGVSADPRTLKFLMDMSPPKSKKELLPFFGTINYLSKFSPATACKPLWRLTSVKTEWIMEKKLPELIWQSKGTNKRRCIYEVL